MNAEDRLLCRLAQLASHPEQQKKVAADSLRKNLPIARKARWAYSHYLAKNGGTGWVPESFVEDYLAAWSESILYFANGSSGQISIQVPANDRRLFVGWHFPEYPLMLDAALRHGVLVLVAKYASWMEPLRAKGCLYEFRTRRFSSKLIRHFLRGKPIYAMLDHCYEETNQLPVDFLGYPARTPVGIFRLASRYHYNVSVISIRQNVIRPIKTFAPCDEPAAIASKVNGVLEREILRNPARWLQWPSVDSRWIGVDYGE